MHPYITIAGIVFPTYLLCAAVGIGITMVVFSKLLVDQLLFRKYIKMVFWSIAGLLLGAKLFGILSRGLNSLYNSGYFNWAENARRAGIVYLGGLLGFLGSFWCLCRWKGGTFKEIANMFAVVIPLFHSIGRIGCYLGGCCYGKEYNKLGAVLYRVGGKETMRFPTQIVESVFEFAFFIILYGLYKKRKNKCDGKLLMVYMYGYSVFRFIIEFYRGDSIRGVYGILSFSQIVCLVVFGWLLNYSTIVLGRRNRDESSN